MIFDEKHTPEGLDGNVMQALLDLEKASGNAIDQIREHGAPTKAEQLVYKIRGDALGALTEAGLKIRVPEDNFEEETDDDEVIGAVLYVNSHMRILCRDCINAKSRDVQDTARPIWQSQFDRDNSHDFCEECGKYIGRSELG